MTVTVPSNVIGELRAALAGSKKSKISQDIVNPRDEVLARFQPVFSSENVVKITEEEFRSFLVLENNRHWSGLQRQGPKMCDDMDSLRTALSILVDEEREISSRLDEAIEKVIGMGKNIATAILLISQPDQYGVWNNRSEANLKRLGIWPAFERGESFGSRYVKVNQVLLHLRDVLHEDLWTLDALWWYLDQGKTEEGDVQPNSLESEQRFGLERHLHEFLRDNWSHVELSSDWDIYQEPGDDEAGYEYSCDVGRIDLLAKHKRKPHWLVIELKRNQTSDQTVGQLLRYVGWVKKNLAGEKEVVHGMIICREADEGLRYALSTVTNVSLKYYEVEFHLREPK